MDRAEFDRLLAEGEDQELLEAIWDYLPEDEDDWGKYDGDPLRVTQYATAEICNGGFFQFYSNGIFDPRTLASYFQLLGANELASCVEDSIAVFPDGVPPVRTSDDIQPIDERIKEMGITSQSFSEIDDRFFAAYGDLDDLWAKRVRENTDLYFSYVSE